LRLHLAGARLQETAGASQLALSDAFPVIEGDCLVIL
jgi:hypothetical protein